jgi:hypothetical protein
MAARFSTAEATQPWVLYHYGRTHDGWWPIWSSTRFLGRAAIDVECIVCGDRSVVRFRMPRFGPVPPPVGGRHPSRQRYLDEHAHPERGAPMSWARPLANLDAHPGGLDLDAMALRLEADLGDPEGGGA